MAGASDRNRLLGVNIDHVATLRQVRGVDYPDLAEAVRAAERGGADFITAHLREDRRHIQDADVQLIMEACSSWLNLEISIDREMVGIACERRPRTVCLVPEKREELTTEGGLDVAGEASEVRAAVERLSDAGVAASLFIDPDEGQVRASASAGAKAIELHTGTYANASGTARDSEVARLRKAAELAHGLGLVVNLGHGLTVDNVAEVRDLPHAHEFNIGHSIVASAVLVGLERAVSDMRKALGL